MRFVPVFCLALAALTAAAHGNGEPEPTEIREPIQHEGFVLTWSSLKATLEEGLDEDRRKATVELTGRLTPPDDVRTVRRQVRLFQATDPDGRDLRRIARELPEEVVPDVAGDRPLDWRFFPDGHVRGAARGGWDVVVRLDDLDRLPSSIATLRGEVHLDLVGGSEVLAFDLEPEGDFREPVEGLRVRLTHADVQELAVGIEMERDMETADVPQLSSTVLSVQLLDDEGRQADRWGGSSHSRTRGPLQTLTAEYTFRAPAGFAPVRAQLEVATELRAVAIPFHLKDVALPGLLPPLASNRSIR